MKIYKIPPQTKAIIFDIDSTLYSHKEYALQQNQIQIHHYGQLEGISDHEALHRIEAIQRNWAEKHNGEILSLGNTCVQLGYPIEESIRWREALLEPADFLVKNHKLVATLEVLSKKYQLACLTNNPVLVGRKTLAALGVEEFFPLVIGLDTCKVSKPHPAPFLLAVEKLGCRVEHCLSVGDRFNIDIELPLELGMGGILVAGVEDVYKLPQLLT
ncbi:MAG: HAD family hydrolase [Treponema sp.]|nr:HAD family hydrolase [Treponema sp.]